MAFGKNVLQIGFINKSELFIVRVRWVVITCLTAITRRGRVGATVPLIATGGFVDEVHFGKYQSVEHIEV